MPTKSQKRLLETLVRIAESKGLETTDIVVPFTNDDLPNFLRRFSESQKYQKKHPSKIKYAA